MAKQRANQKDIYHVCSVVVECKGAPQDLTIKLNTSVSIKMSYLGIVGRTAVPHTVTKVLLGDEVQGRDLKLLMRIQQSHHPWTLQCKKIFGGGIMH